MDSDDENDIQPQWKGVPGTIILINAIGNSKYNNFHIGHVATCNLIKHYMRSSNSQNVGVFVFGIENPPNNSSTFDTSVLEIIPLNVPTVNDYKKLKMFDISLYCEEKQFKLADVLWHCSKVLSNFKKTLSSKRIIILTPLDVLPTVTDQEATINRARDLIDANIDLDIINISEKQLKIESSFCDKLLKVANRGEDFVLPEPIFNSQQVEKLMCQDSHRNLALAKLNFTIGNNFTIGVSVYTLLESQKYPKSINLHRETNNILTSATKTLKICVDDNDYSEKNEQANKTKEIPLLRSEILYYQEYGGERIQFTDSEMKEIKNPFGPPMLKLLGFKPIMHISKEKCYLKHSYFVFPNENVIEGSTIAFKALYKACNEMQMAAICVLCTRINAKVINVALIPNSKPLDLNVDIGFDVVPIPFIENVRELNLDNDEEEIVKIEEAHKSLLKDVLGKISIDYKSDMFEDPKKQSKYKALEAIALGEDDDLTFADTTKPNPEKFHDIKEDLFEELFGPFGAVSLKRVAPNLTHDESKKVKIEQKDIDEDLLRGRLEEKMVNKYTVQQLKDILKYKCIKNLPALNGLKKQELVELVYKYCD